MPGELYIKVKQEVQKRLQNVILDRTLLWNPFLQQMFVQRHLTNTLCPIFLT
jgi:hypothetical protein